MEAGQLKVYVELILSHLDFSNTPKGLAKAFESVTQAEETCKERVFLNVGFQAWFAFFLSKRATKTHFDGRAQCIQMLNEIEAFPVETCRSLAQQVHISIPASSQKKFDDVYNKTIKPLQVNTEKPPKRRRTEDEDGSLLATNIRNSVSPVNDASQSDAHFNFGNPPILRVINVLPVFTAGAIMKQRSNDIWKAAITMSFLDASSFGHKLGCMMSLEITSNKVERLASELFDVHIESTGGHRYLILPSGLRVIPSPDLILRGCKRHAMLEWLGHDIDTAIRTSPAFKEEAEQGNPLTECISMTISNRATESAVINLSLDEKEGVRIRKKLYE